MHAAVHTPQGQAPPTLASDLALIASLSPDHLSTFCGVARALLRTPEDPATFRKAAKGLGVEVSIVEDGARALCYLMVSAATAGRPAEHLLQGIELELPTESSEALISFYKEVVPELERELRTELALPRYKSLEWRLQVQLGGRFAPRQAPQASFLLKLHTSGGADGPNEHLFKADLPNMRRLASELEAALREDRSSHSRRIARRL